MGGLLRALLAVLAGYLLVRLVRRPLGSQARRPPPRARRGGLDPDRAVRASWSEVDEEGKEEPRGP